MARGRYRRHSPHFKLQICSDIRTGVMGCGEAQNTFELSANLIQTWLAQYDAGEMTVADIESPMINEYEAKIVALERKVGQLTMIPANSATTHRS
jgi:transposase-like protein